MWQKLPRNSSRTGCQVMGRSRIILTTFPVIELCIGNELEILVWQLVTLLFPYLVPYSQSRLPHKSLYFSWFWDPCERLVDKNPDGNNVNHLVPCEFQDPSPFGILHDRGRNMQPPKQIWKNEVPKLQKRTRNYSQGSARHKPQYEQRWLRIAQGCQDYPAGCIVEWNGEVFCKKVSFDCSSPDVEDEMSIIWSQKRMLDPKNLSSRK